MTALLAVEGLKAGYNREVAVINGVDLAVDDGEIVAIVGPNGAGKSTVLKALFGQVPFRQGTVLMEGRDMARLRPYQVARHGMGYVPQRDNVFAAMTVAENLEIGATPRPGMPLRARMAEIFDLFPLLAERRRQLAGSMSGGERQLVAMARALMASPGILLLDEPSAGLSPHFVDIMFEQIAAINRSGVAILLVEQNARRALALAHRGYVLDLGRNRYQGRGSDLLDDPNVARLYLG